MTKAEIVAKVSSKRGLDRETTQRIVEDFMDEVKASLERGDNVYLRGFGSFIIKLRAEKTARNISKDQSVVIPAHNIPSFKPSKVFVDGVKNKVKAPKTNKSKK